MIAARGYVMRPLVANVLGSFDNATVVACDQCGQDCWKRHDIEPDPLPAGYIPVCTECALRLALQDGD